MQASPQHSQLVCLLWEIQLNEIIKKENCENLHFLLCKSFFCFKAFPTMISSFFFVNLVSHNYGIKLKWDITKVLKYLQESFLHHPIPSYKHHLHLATSFKIIQTASHWKPVEDDHRAQREVKWKRGKWRENVIMRLIHVAKEEVGAAAAAVCTMRSDDDDEEQQTRRARSTMAIPKPKLHLTVCWFLYLRGGGRLWWGGACLTFWLFLLTCRCLALVAFSFASLHNPKPNNNEKSSYCARTKKERSRELINDSRNVLQSFRVQSVSCFRCFARNSCAS